MSIKFVSIPPKKLSQSILSTDSSFKLSDIKGWDGNDLTSADFGTQSFAAFLSSDNTQLEIMEIDPSTIASTSITIVYRGLKFDGTQSTEVTANKLDWPAGITVQIGSDIPQLLTKLGILENAQTWSAVQTFTVLPVSNGGNATSSKQLVTYAQAVAMATGTTNINRIVVAGNGGETITAGQLVYLKVSDGEWYLSDADIAGTVDNIILGIAQGAGSNGVAITNGVLLFGLDSNQTGLTNNTLYYASNTAGSISSTIGTIEVSVGVSRSTTSLLFYPRYNQQITNNQKDALVGTSGTPSSTNKFVTNDDTSGTGNVTRSSVTDSISSKIKFGGDGSDGALNITSGTTNIDVGGASFYILNYTSISITGTGALTFSNPSSNGTIIIIKSQGNVTLTSSTIPNIDASGMGGAGGTGSVQQVTTPSAGGTGNTGVGILDTLGTHGGTGITAGTKVTSNNLYSFSEVTLLRGLITLIAGSGGGGGSGGADGNIQGISGGDGGNGGGALQINCGEALNFTSTLGVSVAGKNGADGTTKSGSNGAAASGGGGGGAGGTCFIIYNTLTSSSGTINSAGGNGGAGPLATDTTGGSGGINLFGGAGGGGAGSYAGAGGSGGAQTSDTNGINGSSTSNARAGGGGGSGASAAYNTSTTRTGSSGGSGGASENSLVVKNNIFT